jgi:hypothetical protein
MIVASAIKLTDGRVFVGKRHGDCFANVIALHTKIGMSEEDARRLHFNCTQGFITDDLHFIDRDEGAYHALKAGQVSVDKDYLLSEDLW